MDWYDFEIEFVDGTKETIYMVSDFLSKEGSLHLYQMNNTVTREKDHLGSFPFENIRKYIYKRRH